MIRERQEEQKAESCGAPQLGSRYPDARHWAKMPRDVVLRLMGPDQALDARLFYACLLWSECGPQRHDSVVLKDHDGFIIRNGSGQPISAKQKDLISLLKLPETSKAEVSRQMRTLFDRGLLSSDGESMYLNASPPPYDMEPEVAGPRNWHIGRTVITIRNLPDDPELRARAIEWLDRTGAQYNEDRKALRARYKELLAVASAEGLILIESSKSSKQQQQGAVVVEEPEPEPEEVEPEPSPEISEVRQALARFDPTVTTGTAEHLIEQCRRNADVDVPAILAMIRLKAQSISSNVRSPIGFLLTTVPNAFIHYRPPKPQSRAAPNLCPHCLGTGILGGIQWETLADLAKLAKSGMPKCCDCPEGRLARDALGSVSGN